MKSQMDVAIKIEIDDREHDKHRSNLAIEKHCYDDMGVQRKCHFSPISNKTDATILTDPIDFNSSLVGVPQIIYFGDNEHDQEKIMVMEMLGLNLDKMFIQSKLNFSLERIHWIAKQLVSVRISSCLLSNLYKFNSSSLPDRSHADSSRSWLGIR